MPALPEPDINQSGAPDAQLRFFQAATTVLLVLLVCAVGYYVYRQHTLQPVTVLVGGKPVAVVENMAAAKALITTVQAQQVGPEYFAHDDPRFAEDVEFQTTNGQTLIDSSDAAAAKLAHAAHTIVDADVIVVDQKPIVGLPDAQTAQAAVDELRDHYASMPPDAPLEEKPSFAQTVTIDRRTVSAALARRNADDAAQVLWTPPPATTYTVKYGETGWIIANKFKMSLTDFLRANAGHDVNRLKPGDSVIISRTFPPIDVIVKKRQELTEHFGGTGLRQMTEIDTYMDGVEVGAPVATSMLTLQRATPRYSID